MSTESARSGHLDIGGVFEATTEIYKRCFGTVWIVALILLIPSAIIVALLGDEGIGSLIGSIVNLVAGAWLIGSVVRIVQDVEEDGQVDWGVGQILSSVAPRLVAIILLTFVVGILVFIGLIFFIIPGVILALMWFVSIPSMVVEEKGVFDSMSRSSELTKSNRMRIIGVGLVVLLAYVVIFIVAALFAAISPIIGAIAIIAAGILLYPYISIISAVLYYRLRELKDGVVVAVEETVIVEEQINPQPPTA